MFDKLLSVLDAGTTVDVITIIDSASPNDDQIGKMLLIHADGRVDGQCNEYLFSRILDTVRTAAWVKPVTLAIEDQSGGKYRVFWERVSSPLRAVVFGGGHISRPLVQILGLLNFDVTVVDDRLDFANPARFPAARKVFCESFANVFDKLTIDDNTVIIIVTRGHRYDLDCLRATIGRQVRYLGMIGSKRRVREVIDLLRAEGIPEEALGRLRAPIGLDIKAETPEEIAVSIAAEVISALRGGSGAPLSGYREGAYGSGTVACHC